MNTGLGRRAGPRMRRGSMDVQGTGRHNMINITNGAFKHRENWKILLEHTPEYSIFESSYDIFVRQQCRLPARD